jgi:glycosyltransferase involved in cell wall biosynthesis
VRILQVVHGFPPFNIAGVEVVAHALSRCLVERGHQVKVFHRVAEPSRPEYTVQRVEVDGLPVVRVNNTFRECDRFERTYRNEVIDRIFGELLEAERPDVVHFHHVTCLSTNLIAEAFRRGIPIVYTLHDYWLICQRGQFLKTDLSICPGQDDGACVKCLAWQLNLRGGSTKVARVLKQMVPAIGTLPAAGIKRFLKGIYTLYAQAFFASQVEAREKVRVRMEHIKEICGMVDLFISPSRFLKERYVEFGIPEDRILYSTLGFETSYYKRTSGLNDGRIRFGYLGTLIPPKGLHILIEAFNEIADDRASLHIYGHTVPYEGYENYLDHLKGMIRSPRIHMEGFYEHREVGRILDNLDVLVVPSIWYENSPLTIQEAMLAGVPVITSDLGGMAELVQDGVSGLTFRPRDPADLRKKMMRFLQEEGLLEKVRPEAKVVKGLERSAGEHEEIYLRLGAKKAAEKASMAPMRPSV